MIAHADTLVDGVAQLVGRLERTERRVAELSSYIVRLERRLHGEPPSATSSSVVVETDRPVASVVDAKVRLTPAQRHVVDELCEGRTARQIAERDCRALTTVQNHIGAAMAAYGVTSRAALVAKAMRA